MPRTCLVKKIPIGERRTCSSELRHWVDLVFDRLGDGISHAFAGN